jgi:hypothetical protein
MSRYWRSTPPGRARLPLAVLGAALLAASCTHGVTPHAAARAVHASAQASHTWPGGKPITYSLIDCGGDPSCSSGFTGSVPSALRRPLRLPALAHGQCPTHRARVVDPHAGPAEGPGPIYPVIDSPAGQPGVLTFADPPPPGSLTTGTGFGEHKVLWIVAPRYRGPALIRGAQFGGHHPVKFDTGTGILFPELQLPPQSQDRSVGLPSRGWRGLPSGTDLRAPGCYAWQIDGTNFSYMVVFKAVQTR